MAHRREAHPLVRRCPLVHCRRPVYLSACVSIAAKEEPGSARHKFYTKFDIVLIYSRDPDMLIKVSNALNIQIRDKVVQENFWSQLKNARAKWIEKG